jgi:hypothetical protein
MSDSILRLLQVLPGAANFPAIFFVKKMFSLVSQVVTTMSEF